MANKPIPTPERLRQLLDFDAATGKMFWRHRAELRGADKIFNGRFAGKEALTCVSAGGRRTGIIEGCHVLAHRALWALAHGEWPSGQIDHINGNPLDNRICNLRDVSQQENMMNRKRYTSNRSGVVGVSFHRRTGKWQADMCIEGKGIYIGLFDTMEAAAAARKAAQIEHGFHPNHGRS